MPRDLLRRINASVAGDPAAPGCYVVSGGVGAGKTRFLRSLVASLEAEGIAVGGVLAPRVMDGEQTVGYDVQDLRSGAKRAIARLTPPGAAVGRYFIRAEGVSFAHRCIERACADQHVVVLDEVGRLELRNEGHYAALMLIKASAVVPVVAVRDSLVDEICQAFGLSASHVVSVDP